MQKVNYLLVIAGPTAVGKTTLAIELAEYFNTEIISADARQFYQEMTIGTAKPTVEELATVNHYFINNLSITNSYTVGIYEKEALSKLEELFKNAPIVVLTGGSGLYIKTLIDGMDDIPDVDPQIRIQLNEEFRTLGLQPLLEALAVADPDYYNEVDQGNPIRIIRALEVFRGTGMPYSFFRKAIKKERFFKPIFIGLTREREELYERIDKRMELMLRQGLEKEVVSLRDYRHVNALQTVGYKEVFDYLDGLYDYEEMIRLLKRNSRRYAKRQLTWFGKDKRFKWFHPNQKESIIKYIVEEMGLEANG